MENQELTESVKKHIKNGNRAGIFHALSEIHPSEIAKIIDPLETEEQSFVLSSLGVQISSEVIPEMDENVREELLSRLDEQQIADIAGNMDSDDAADLIQELPEEKAEEVLSKIDPEELREVEPLLKYPDDSAGGIMQTEVLTGGTESPVRETVERIRELSRSREIEEYQRVYVVDDLDKLVGMVSLGKLAISDSAAPLRDIMESAEITLSPLTDQEETAVLFRKYNLLSAPVIDEDGKLLGRITGDDIMDVISEEAEEDIYQLVGLGDHLHPIHTPTAERIKVRIPWIILTLLGELLIAFVVLHNFQVTLEQFAILAAFMPAIMAAGGNVGVQTNTVIIRSLGMETIRGSGQILSILLAEIKVGFILGVICGVIGAITVELINTKPEQIDNLAVGATVFIAMISATVATSSIGVFLPIVLKKLNIDPAASSGPFLMMFNDILGSVFYLFLGTLLLF